MPTPLDPDASVPRPDGIGTHLAYRFGIVLLLLLVTFVFLTLEPSGAWARSVTVVLLGTTLFAAMSASRASRRMRRFTLIATAIAVAGALATANTGGTDVSGMFWVLDALLVGIAPVAIARSVMRRQVIDGSTVLAALCIYVLLGMLWAFVFAAIGGFDSRAFFVQQPKASSADYLYFSFVTQTTVGYGDLTVAHNLGRALVSLEALIGQIYLVTIVAVLVSHLTPRARNGERP